MKPICSISMSLAILFSPVVMADAYKCTTPSGKVVITDNGCAGVGRHDKAYESENISIERQRQAQAVSDKNMDILERNAAEERAYRESVSRQQAIGQLQAPPSHPAQSSRPSIPQEKPLRRRAAPPAVVTNCDTGGCWDTQGRRYNNGAGDTKFRSDGKTCQQVGPNMICN